MKIFTHKNLSEVQEQMTVEKLERTITDLEIELAEQDQAITDHDIAIAELQEK